ncbi:MAG: M20/M25/M40 family metallo-hydrolase [Planctomycetes bacterium]|nr:M20/M25/M40 family metallo-hydrolase [Planctomycetota bacterium]
MRALSMILLLAANAFGQAAPGLPAGAPDGLALITRAELKRHAEFLASDALGGRYTGTPGQVKAAEYIAKHFAKLRLQPLGGGKRSFLQQYPLERTYLDPKGTSIAFGGKNHTTGFAVIPGKDSKPVRVSGSFVYCGTGNPEQVPKALLGRIPVVVLGAPGGAAGDRGSMMRGNRLVQRAAAVSRDMASRNMRVVVFAVTDPASSLLDNMNYRALLPEKHLLEYAGERGPRRAEAHAIVSLLLAPKGSRALLTALGCKVDDAGVVTPPSSGKSPKVAGRVSVHVREDKKFHAVNVCAVLRGTSRATEAVVFSAHMDHMGTRMDGDPFNGADDNASGTAGLLTIASAFAGAQSPPKRSIVFLAVSGEELGLWGSHWYSEHPTWPLGQIVADVNTDMIGRDTQLSPKGTVSVTPSKDHQQFSTLVRTAAEIAGKLGMTLSNGDTYYSRSDHFNFARKGVPVVFFCDGEHADYHKVTDHADKLDFAKMEQIARLAYWTGWQTAQAAGRPKTLGATGSWTK